MSSLDGPLVNLILTEAHMKPGPPEQKGSTRAGGVVGGKGVLQHWCACRRRMPYPCGFGPRGLVGWGLGFDLGLGV